MFVLWIDEWDERSKGKAPRMMNKKVERTYSTTEPHPRFAIADDRIIRLWL